MADPYRSVLLFGPPGAGKGTQGKRLGALPRCVHLATGDMFRGLDKQSDLGRRVTGYSSRGELVPDELTVELWAAHVQGLIARKLYAPVTDLLLLDGIPRSVGQARLMRDRIDPVAILHLVVTNLDAMVQRMAGRALKEGRADDADPAVIRRRFDVYDAQTAPVLDAYAKALVQEIDAEQSVDAVFSECRAAVERLLR